MNVHLVPLRKIAKVIGRTVNDARPDAAAGHPDGEAVRVVVATVSGAGALRQKAFGWLPDYPRQNAKIFRNMPQKAVELRAAWAKTSETLSSSRSMAGKKTKFFSQSNFFSRAKL